MKNAVGKWEVVSTTVKPCGCKGKTAEGDKPAPSPLACAQCLEKHIGAAAVLAGEVAEEPSRLAERVLCAGHLACAEEHARALGWYGFAATVRKSRIAFQMGVPPAAAAPTPRDLVAVFIDFRRGGGDAPPGAGAQQTPDTPDTPTEKE